MSSDLFERKDRTVGRNKRVLDKAYRYYIKSHGYKHPPFKIDVAFKYKVPRNVLYCYLIKREKENVFLAARASAIATALSEASATATASATAAKVTIMETVAINSKAGASATNSKAMAAQLTTAKAAAAGETMLKNLPSMAYLFE